MSKNFVKIGFGIIVLNLAFWCGLIYFGLWCLRNFGVI